MALSPHVVSRISTIIGKPPLRFTTSRKQWKEEAVNTVHVYSDGSCVYVNPDGSKIIYDPAGSARYIPPKKDQIKPSQPINSAVDDKGSRCAKGKKVN
jgi:hypothetical protein